MDTRPYKWIYVMSNPFMPGLVKIGFTGKHPSERAAELSTSSGVPAPFETVFAAAVADTRASEVENYLHKELDIHRINPLREFFSLSESGATELVKRLLKRIGIDADDVVDIGGGEVTSPEELHPSGDKLEGIEDGRKWPMDADKPLWELVLKYRRPDPADCRFIQFMHSVVGADLRKPDSPEYLLGFHEGVHDRYVKEEYDIEERRETQ